MGYVTYCVYKLALPLAFSLTGFPPNYTSISSVLFALPKSSVINRQPVASEITRVFLANVAFPSQFFRTSPVTCSRHVEGGNALGVLNGCHWRVKRLPTSGYKCDLLVRFRKL